MAHMLLQLWIHPYSANIA